MKKLLFYFALLGGSTLCSKVAHAADDVISVHQASAGSAVSWLVGLSVEDVSVANGLPVVSIGRDDWHRHLKDLGTQPKAFRRTQGKLIAEHPSGWRWGVVARSQAELKATPDSVRLAAYLDGKNDPVSAADFEVAASHMGWQGLGFEVGTPWMALPVQGTWEWSADIQWLQLKKLRVNEIAGQVSHIANGSYVFALNASRANEQINNPFIGSSSSSGYAGSLSLSLRGQLTDSLSVNLRAQDIGSRLQWNRLATEDSRINSQVVTKLPDGTLDYGPVIQGIQARRDTHRNMGVSWSADARWNVPLNQFSDSAVAFQLKRFAGLNEVWIGWGAAIPSAHFKWQVSVEPIRHAVKSRLDWAGFYLTIGTDGRGKSSEYRQVAMGWRGDF